MILNQQILIATINLLFNSIKIIAKNILIPPQMNKPINSIKGYDIVEWKSNVVGICRNIKSNQEFIFKIPDETKEIAIMDLNKQETYLTKMIKKMEIQNKMIIIMEKGQCDLKAYIKKFKDTQISEKNIQNLTISILKGLQSMHKRDIWHRDLKPQNIYIFLKDEDEDLKDGNVEVYAKLGDFGHSKLVEIKNSQHTKGIGTAIYQSPELREGSKNYTNKIDIWALGLTLFELYTSQDYSNYFFSNSKLNQTKDGVDKIRAYLKERFIATIKNNQTLFNKLNIMIENTIQYNMDNRESIGYFIKLFEDPKIKKEVQKSIIRIQEDKKIQLLTFEKKHDVELKIQRYQKINQKLDKLIESTRNSLEIRMKKAMINNLERQKIQNFKILEKYDDIGKNVDSVIKSILDFDKEQDKKEIQRKKNQSFTIMKNTLNDYRFEQSKKLDLCFMIDVTGSMDDLIDTVRKYINQISDLVKEQFTQVRLACVAYRDLDGFQNHKPEIFQFTADSKKLLSEISKLQAFGGGDLAQDINGGFQGLFDLNWEQYTKAVIHFTDAPCHHKDYNNLKQSDYDNYFDKIPQSNLPYRKIFKELRSVGINYFLIPIADSVTCKESLDFMYKKYEEDWKNAKVYRGRCNTIGQIRKISNFKLQQFKQIIKGVSQQTKIISNNTIRVKRRLDNFQLAEISAADQLNDNDEFDQ